ncbi:MAG: hypothetical protein AAFR14_12845 [Bacteroidota bacterium]
MRTLLFLFLSGAFALTAQEIDSADSVMFYEVQVVSTRASQLDPISFTNISQSQIEERYLGQDPAALLSQLSPSIPRIRNWT